MVGIAPSRWRLVAFVVWKGAVCGAPEEPKSKCNGELDRLRVDASATITRTKDTVFNDVFLQCSTHFWSHKPMEHGLVKIGWDLVGMLQLLKPGLVIA